MLDRLKIGVVIKENYHATIGGGFGYYQTLINKIDSFTFHPLLEFVFVRFSEGEILPFQKKFSQFVFDDTIPEVERCKKRIAQINKIPIFFIKQNLRRRYEMRIPELTAIHALKRKAEIEKWLVDQKIDILYYLIPAGGEINFPFVTTHWDIGHYSMFAFPEVSMNKTFNEREDMYQNIFKKALAIFCESDSGKRELSHYKQINPERIFIVPLFPGNLICLDLSSEQQQGLIQKEFGLKKGNFFLYPAQFWSHKNHYHLLLAFKNVNEKYPELKLVLPGSDKGNLGYIKEVIEQLNLISSVILPGFISNEALYSLYKNAIALVMPTFLGPTNMPLLEAAQLGCTVITSAFEGHKELLGNYATYINPLDENEIAVTMINNFENKSAHHEFKNAVNQIDSVVQKVEENFLAIRKIRKTWRNNFQQF